MAIGEGIAVKQMDNDAAGAIILTDLGVTHLKSVKQQMRKAKEELPEEVLVWMSSSLY